MRCARRSAPATNSRRRIRFVIAPLALPGLGAAGLFAFIAAWGDFLIRIAKKWNLIAIILSQIARKYRSEANTEEEIREVSLCDAKESGSFENSCSVVLGMWKSLPASAFGRFEEFRRAQCWPR